MSRAAIQVITRQVLAIPVDGGIVIAEKFQSRTIHTEEVTVTTMWLANVVSDLAVQFVAYHWF